MQTVTFGRQLAPGLAASLMVALWASAPAEAQDIVYSINQSGSTPIVSSEGSVSDTEVGTLTTNGTLGALTASDILSYNIVLTDTANPANDFTLTTSNSLVEFNGSGLSASATNLSFNYGATGDYFFIQAANPGLYSGYHYVCFSAGATVCASGDTIVPNYVYQDGVAVSQTGIQNLGGSGGGTAPTSAPEMDPTSSMSGLALLLGALAVVRGRRTVKLGGAASIPA